MTAEDLRILGMALALWAGASLLLALALFLLVIRHLKEIEVPPDASFGETLQVTPFLLVVFIDLLDWGLDILAAPVAWVVLDRLGLRALRNVSTVEALIPFTQPIPTLTLSWFWVRIFGADSAPFNSRNITPEKGSRKRKR
ncbi:MAG: hypothetical protein R3272_00475 [Candidatus Promineifilaceae bacterium]|nr:hypothetical protein [Candidatus Promineifilaceae bacterium]